MADPTGAEILRVRRLAIGTSTDTTTLPDADVSDLWNNEGGAGVLLTAAAACELLAARFSVQYFRWTADGQSMDKTMQADHMRQRATELRRQYYGSGAITTTLSGATSSTDEFAS